MRKLLKSGILVIVMSVLLTAPAAAQDMAGKNFYSGLGTVTKKAPAFHSPGHISLWYSSPFKGIDAHLFLAIVIVLPISAVMYYIYRKRTAMQFTQAKGREEVDSYRLLLSKERALRQKLFALEQSYAASQVGEDEYQLRQAILKKKLLGVRKQLKSYSEGTD